MRETILNTDNIGFASAPAIVADDIYWDTIFNAIGHPVIILDKDHRIVAANSASRHLTGMPQEEMLGRYCFEVFHLRSSSEPADGCPMEKMLRSGVMEAVDMEMEALGKIYLVSCTPILAADGSIDKVIHIATDITERKLAEQALKSSYERFQAVMDNLDVIVYVADMESHEVLFVNKLSKEVFGDITGRVCWESIQAGQSGPCAFCTNSRLINSDGTPAEPVIWEFQNTANNRWYECRDQAIRWIDGRLVRLELAADITSRKKLEASLKEQQNFTNSLILYSPVAQFVLDKEHRVQVWNKACEHLTGCAYADMLGSKDHWKAFYIKKQPTLADVLLDGDFDRLPKLYTHVSKSIHNPDGYRAEGWFAQVNGKDRYFMIEAAPTYDNQGVMTHVLETISDLTDSKSLEEQLLQAQKMESVGQLSGGIAHEFNNILAVILGYGQAMRKGIEPDSINMKDLDQIMTAAERAAVLTKGLLAFSRKQHVTMKNLDLNVLTHTTLKSFSRILGDDIIINESLDAVPVTVNADQALLTQVLMNLMANARDAMPNGGELNIRTGRALLVEPYLTPFCSIPPGRYARLTLSDCGHGIEEQDVPKIFEPFFTTKDVGKGTGLGLSVVYGIVSQHNGYITVSSPAGQGTAFDLYFPLIEQPTPTSSAPEVSSGLRGGAETILLADDEPTLLEIFSDILSELGYQVITAIDGVDAVEKFVTHQDKIKLLILDVQMSRKSGLQAYKEIKLIQPGCKALFVSGFNLEQFQGYMTLENGTELLMKPFTPQDMASRVRKMLDAER